MTNETTDTLQQLGEVIDAYVSADVTARNVAHLLYRHARDEAGGPLSTTAARALVDRVDSGDRVLIATGWPSRSWLFAGLTETDGPVGAAVLARAVEQCLDAVPVLVMEERLVHYGEASLKAAGLILGSLEQALASKPGPPSAAVGAVAAFTADMGEAADAAEELCDRVKPRAVIANELPGLNPDDKYHTVSGREVPDELVPKVDVLFREARRRGAVTVGIGDGGNELGMGSIRDRIKDQVPHGTHMVAATPVDHLIAACVSNWGAFGLAAALAAATDTPEMLARVSVPRITRRLADMGVIDGLTARPDPYNDGTSQDFNQALMTMLQTAVEMHLAGWVKE